MRISELVEAIVRLKENIENAQLEKQRLLKQYEEFQSPSRQKTIKALEKSINEMEGELKHLTTLLDQKGTSSGI